MRTMWIVDSVGLADVVVVDVTEGHERSWSNGMSSAGSSFFPRFASVSAGAGGSNR